VLEPLRNPFRREVEVDPDVQYRLASKKSLRPLAQERKAELDAAAKLMNKRGRHNGIVQKLQKHWQNRRQQRAARRKAHGRLRMLRRRLHHRVMRAVLRFLKGVRKVGGLPFRKFRTKAKIEELREKERIKRNRMEMMEAILHETREEEKHKSALRQNREKRISTEVEPSEATQHHHKVIEKERSEKGTGSSLTSSQETNPDKLEDEADSRERAEPQESHDSAAHAAQEKGKEKVNDEEHGADDGTPTGQSGHDDQQSAALSHAEERKMKKEKKREEKMQKKERKGKEKLGRNHSVESRHSQAAAESDAEQTRHGHHHRGHHSEAPTDAVGASTARGADTASVASSDRQRRFHGLLGRQQTKMRLWEEKEKDKWATLRKKWGAKRASQSARYPSSAPNRAVLHLVA
jgi:hypothetical protein